MGTAASTENNGRPRSQSYSGDSGGFTTAGWNCKHSTALWYSQALPL
ncbi:hypothetical protein [Sporisorium scitamineum]|uniref:Uncharacterized protein n=1 Tax=Sporisorium scitamineum TaxID=49012 RepID=A0A0F7S5G9_9BASI|nr:hypothetical protein [Sporisorium scitamineum]